MLEGLIILLIWIIINLIVLKIMLVMTETDEENHKE